MEKILEESAALDPTLLVQDREDQYDKLALALVAKINKLTPQELAAAEADLNGIPPSSHTILYVCILLASIETSPVSGKAASRQLPATILPEGSLWPYIVQLLLEFDPIQARYCGTQLMRIVDYVALGAEQTANYIPAIQLLHHLILRLDSTASTLTSTHRTFIRLCLLSQAYTDAIGILDRPIYHIPNSQIDLRPFKYICSNSDQPWTYLSPATGLTQPISSRTYLEYYVMGAMCYMAMRRYRDALFFLEVVIAAPTVQNVASVIMVEAYKKWLLLGLLINGITPTIPRSANQNALKHIRALAKPYECVADAFKGNDIGRLRAEMEAANVIWQEDGNYGLMVEVYQAFQKFSVLRLGKTFSALPVVEVAKRMSPDPTNSEETEVYLEHLIANGDIGAVVVDSDNSGEKILRFLPASVSLKSESQVEVALATQTQELRALLKHIQDTEHRMEVSKEYIDWLKKLKKMKDEERKNGRSAAVDEVEEDVMDEF
ncbi:uncharacterized protein Z518_09847 [Rhinocladiella mackenziei CBS 650.93]|uniref:COP9 signalosome complex subunit 3 N-terminal helical repeats domain-containing protein n=1 Tax=Rhinocladiella mackenziei CBS 650.93 TaxID=1442369 RepID=A0A0D2FFI8_9EURO|nr:uncharacterized protein Z518_09847 [Rhinocladiella mackenziei CBS 650.93]KIX00782.1 hypothetical protein Z518_09847 [Rhinocladiella mackenziei CBS 650.93]